MVHPNTVFMCFMLWCWLVLLCEVVLRSVDADVGGAVILGTGVFFTIGWIYGVRWQEVEDAKWRY